MASDECEPFKHHVYIGFCPVDKKLVYDLRAQLERNGVICCIRKIDETQSSIDEGVTTSKKCLLYLSPEYLEDKWYNMETAPVLKKVDLFGKNTLIIMKSESMKEVPVILRGFTEQVLPEDDKVAQIATFIKTEPTMILRYGPAASYFHGYLNIILPDFRKRLTEETVEIEWLPNTLKKMLIIVPESCSCPTAMDKPGKIIFTNKFVLYAGNRAGNQKRDYKNSLYKVMEGNDAFYFAGEFATPLVTMYETYKAQCCNMKEDDLHMERDVFYYSLKALLSHSDNARCRDQFKLVYWSDLKNDNDNSDKDLHQFLLSVIKTELELEKRNEASKNPSSGEQTQVPGQEATFEPMQGVSGCNPTSLYEGIEKYPMRMKSIQSDTKRGKCLIINIIKYTNNILKYRAGSTEDTGILEKLFEDLHFDVETHIDVDSETLQSLLVTMNKIDHSRYVAFICCILSHGKLGSIYTSDGKPVEILNIVEYFGDRQCPSLKGKPKMFFIQACQEGVNVESQKNSSGDQAGKVESQKNPSGAQVSDTSDLASELAIRCTVEEESKGSGAVESDAGPSITDENSSAKANRAILVPSYPDFLMSYSTLPGAVSYRDTNIGSFYIQKLDTCLRNHDEIDRALKCVTMMVREELRERGELAHKDFSQQLPFHLTCAMERLIYL